MQPKKIEKEEVHKIFDIIKEGYAIFAPAGREFFERVNEFDDINMSKRATAKNVFFPIEQSLFKFERRGKEYDIKKEMDAEKKVALFGVRACDTHAIKMMDNYMMGDIEDEYYSSLRNNCLIIGFTCVEPWESCFCTYFGNFEPCFYDLWLTDIGNYYVIETGSNKGERILEMMECRNADEEDMEKKEMVIERAKKKIKVPMKEFNASVFSNNYHSKKWDELMLRCISCGKCNFTCPTCHCFDVFDKIDIYGNGERKRRWDSCHFYDYARTSAENFRKERIARVKYRVYDKFIFSAQRYGMQACVGCGRCRDVCPAEIDLREIIEVMT